MTTLFNIAYISKNAVINDEETLKREIASILASANENNPKMGITGALLYSGGYFCQVIEGTDEALEELFETIQMDDRHTDVKVLHFEPLENRNFADWSMAFAGIEDKMRFKIDGILDSKDEIKIHELGHDLVATLDELVKHHQALLNLKATDS